MGEGLEVLTMTTQHINSFSPLAALKVLSNYWKLLGPVVAVVAAVANVLGPQWPPGYVIAGVAAMLINLFGPPNTPQPAPAPVPAPPVPPAPPAA